MGASTSKYKLKTNKHQPYRADKPSPPGKPTLKYDPNDLDPETVTIKWDPPLYDGGSKITGYLVEHKRTGSPHWVKASPIKVRQTQLTVCGLEPGWRYQFRASAENENGLSDPSPLSEPLAIFVHRSAAIAPYFVTEIYDLAVLENEKVEFNVSFEGVPSPRISWYKDGLELFSNRCQKVSTEGCLSRYIIYEASISDESEIKCTATNKVGYAVTKAYLKVEAPPTIRLPRQYEDGLIFEKGELIRLKVSVVGQPRPLVFWSFNGERIDTNVFYETEYADSTAILRVKDAQRSHRGEYQIQAVNALGEDVASILVTIANRPQPPTNVSVQRIEGNSVTLEWMKPEDDGGCKIGSYIIEYYKTGWNVWLKAATSRQLTITLEDLIAASQYRFRIKAENPYGVSDASQETEKIFIPDVKKNIFRPEDVPKHIRESEIFRFPFNLEQELQTASETDCSSENLTKKKLLLAPEKPKRKKIKVPINNTQNASFMSNDNKDYRIPVTSSSQFSIPTDDVSRTSSELMLVLVPSLEDLTRCKGKGSLDGVPHFPSKNLSNLAPPIPPPLSLSAPELGSEIQFFKPLQRNCVSSTEILHESTIARFYKELQEENGINKLKEQLSIISRRKSTMNSIEDEVIASGLSINNTPIQSEKAILKKRSPPQQASVEMDRPFSNLPHSKFVENNSETDDHLMYENLYKSDLNDSTRSRSPTWRRKPDKLPDEPSIRASSSESGTLTQGRYSPLSGTFHYPDLFMESLTRSPQFKPTSRSLTEVVSDMAAKKQILVESYAASTPLNELPSRKPNPKVIVTEHEDFMYNSPSSSEFSGSRSELHGRNRYWNEDEESDSDSLSEAEEDEVSSDEDDFDYKYENDTYHPRDRIPLSFEQALAISNPKRSVSPINDLFLESEPLHADDKNDGLHYFNRNYDFDERDRMCDENRRPKSILKYSAYPNEFETTNSPTSTLTYGSSSLHRASSQSPLKLFKKQVRIEEPVSRNNYEVQSTAKNNEDTSHVIINHYSDIVRHYSQKQKKPSTKLYLTYDELRAAAAEMDDDDIRDNSNDEEEQLCTRAKFMEMGDTTGTICDNYYHLSVPYEQNDRRSPSPKNVDTMLYVARVHQSVHFYFDFVVDLLLFILACWLFCFKDERLAVPVIILLVYRQLYEKVKDRLANFKFGWNNLAA